jgi:hypothetical protein
MAALSGFGVAAAVLAFGSFGPGRDPERPARLPASVAAPPPRPSCSLLADVGTPDAHRWAGLALAGGGLDGFLRYYGGGSRIGDGISAVNPAFCPVLDAIAPARAAPPNGPLRWRVDRRVVVGATLKPMVQAPAGSTITLDMYDAKGMVTHVLPAQSPQGTWTAKAPAGPWLAVIVASPATLANGRPASEAASHYLPALTSFLHGAPGAMVDAVQVDVVAGSGGTGSEGAGSAPIEAPHRPGCETIAAINERVAAGGELSDDDRAKLRACRG